MVLNKESGITKPAMKSSRTKMNSEKYQAIEDERVGVIDAIEIFEAEDIFEGAEESLY